MIQLKGGVNRFVTGIIAVRNLLILLSAFVSYQIDAVIRMSDHDRVAYLNPDTLRCDLVLLKSLRFDADLECVQECCRNAEMILVY